MWNRSTLLTVIPLLVACGSNGGTPADSPATETSTAIAAPAATAPPATPTAQAKTWVDLQAGDCVTGLPAVDEGAVTVTVVDCAATHAAEVFLRAPTAVNLAVADVANQDCVAGFSTYTGRPVDSSQYAVTYLIDSNQDRTSNNPLPSTVICLLQAADGQPLTGSARR